MPRGLLAGALTLLWGGVSWGQPARTPELVIEAPKHLAHVETKIRGFDTDRLADLIRLTGLGEPGAAIRIRVASEESEVARATPPSIAGFAIARDGLVVLFPSRIGSYPYGSLEAVFYHEIAHVLIGRAAGMQPVPRWFNEGLAGAAENTGSLERQTRLAWELLVGERLRPTQLEAMFGETTGDTIRGYVVSDALVRHILQHHGSSTAARILGNMNGGASFELAFFSATGVTVDEIFFEFWSRNVVWQRWIAFLGHPFTVWSLMTLLALVAIWRHRRRRLEQRLRWELEERAENEVWEEHRRKYRIH